MDIKKIKYPHCEKEKEVGFLLDIGGGYNQLSWYSGKPEASVLMKTKIDFGKEIPITAMRCPECGHQDLFAEKIRYNKIED